MTVNKGLLSIVENTPNFSNQALENAVDTLKLGWVAKSATLDSLIVSNGILTASQKTDLKADINNVSHLNLGRLLGDLVRHSATIIDAVYFLILLFFKELNDIPMSTTWVFVGLLCGRELAMATMTGKEKFKTVFPLITKDFIKMMIGLGASVGVVLMIHYVIVPNGY